MSLKSRPTNTAGNVLTGRMTIYYKVLNNDHMQDKAQTTISTNTTTTAHTIAIAACHVIDAPNALQAELATVISKILPLDSNSSNNSHASQPSSPEASQPETGFPIAYNVSVQIRDQNIKDALLHPQLHFHNFSRYNTRVSAAFSCRREASYRSAGLNIRKWRSI